MDILNVIDNNQFNEDTITVTKESKPTFNPRKIEDKKIIKIPFTLCGSHNCLLEIHIFDAKNDIYRVRCEGDAQVETLLNQKEHKEELGLYFSKKWDYTRLRLVDKIKPM